jgi:hypothetical protein
MTQTAVPSSVGCETVTHCTPAGAPDISLRRDPTIEVSVGMTVGHSLKTGAAADLRSEAVKKSDFGGGASFFEIAA